MTEEITTELYCANHPTVETQLRCARCDKPICIKCAKRTPTGYKCPECVRGQQKVFETARWYDYPLAILIAGSLAFLGSLLTRYLGFFIIFIAPIVGTIVAEVVRRVISRRRSRRLFMVTAGAALVGALFMPVLGLLVALLSERAGIPLFQLVFQGIYAFALTSAMYYRLSGIQIRR